jgi:hypothetical protein
MKLDSILRKLYDIKNIENSKKNICDKIKKVIGLFAYVKTENDNFNKSIGNIGDDFNHNILDMY